MLAIREAVQRLRNALRVGEDAVAAVRHPARPLRDVELLCLADVSQPVTVHLHEELGCPEITVVSEVDDAVDIGGRERLGFVPAADIASEGTNLVVG